VNQTAIRLPALALLLSLTPHTLAAPTVVNPSFEVDRYTVWPGAVGQNARVHVACRGGHGLGFSGQNGDTVA